MLRSLNFQFASEYFIFLDFIIFQDKLVPSKNVHLKRCSKFEEQQVKMMIDININVMVQMNEHKRNSCECQKEIETE